MLGGSLGQTHTATFSRTTSGGSGTGRRRAPAAQGGEMPGNVTIPNLGAEPSLDPLVKDLAGSLRTRSDAAADASIANFSRASGGDTGSPLFQFMATTARGQAAGNTGATLANLRLQAEESRAGRQLSREQAQQSAMLQLQGLNNAWALGQGQLALGRDQFNLSSELGRGELALRQQQQGMAGQQQQVGNLMAMLDRTSRLNFPQQHGQIKGSLWGLLGLGQPARTATLPYYG